MIVNDNGDRLKKLLSHMQKFNSNVTGSEAYFYKKRTELEALIDSKGMPTMWFTLSAADNHWIDLQQLMYGRDIGYPDMDDEEAKAKWRRKMTRENPHIVDAYFMKRTKLLLETYYGKNSLECEWQWFRIEYQERGTAHAHGCFKLKCDPGIAQLAQKVLIGHVAERRLVELGLGQSRNVTLRKDDQWEERDEEYEPIPLSSDDELHRLFEDVNVGIDSEEVIHHFNDQFLSTNHPDPPADATDEQVRTCDSDFVQ